MDGVILFPSIRDEYFNLRPNFMSYTYWTCIYVSLVFPAWSSWWYTFDALFQSLVEHGSHMQLIELFCPIFLLPISPRHFQVLKLTCLSRVLTRFYSLHNIYKNNILFLVSFLFFYTESLNGDFHIWMGGFYHLFCFSNYQLKI